MDNEMKAALDKLSRPTWRLLWRDYSEFGEPPAWYLEGARCNERLDNADTALALIKAGYVTQVDANPFFDGWRKDYEITVGGAKALADADTAR